MCIAVTYSTTNAPKNPAQTFQHRFFFLAPGYLRPYATRLECFLTWTVLYSRVYVLISWPQPVQIYEPPITFVEACDTQIFDMGLRYRRKGN